MKPFYTSVLAIWATVTIVGMLTIGQQIYALRICGGRVGDTLVRISPLAIIA